MEQDPFTAAERDTRAMVSAGWWSGAPPQQRQHTIAGRVLVLPDGTWWLFGAWARWYRWHPSDGQWHLCPPPQAPATRLAARPVPQGAQAPGLPPHVVPAGPDFGFDAPAVLPFVGHALPAALTARARATLAAAAALPPAEYPHWWTLFSSAAPSTVAVSWGVMLWCAAAPVFDSRLDDQMLGLWAPYRAKPLSAVDGPRWLTPPPLEALVGLYAERLRASRVDAAVVILRTMWAMASALREDPRFQARGDALLAILGATLNNPTIDYEALPYGDQALVQQWLTRCPPHLAPAMRNESSPGDNFRHAYYALAEVVAETAGDPAAPVYLEPRLIAAALIAADLAVARQDVVAKVVPWLDPEIRFTVQAVLSQTGHPLRRLWPADAVLPDLLRGSLRTAEQRERLLGAMYGVDLAWCRLGGIPARPRGFPVPMAVTGEIIGLDRVRAAAAAAATSVPPPPAAAPPGPPQPQQPYPQGFAGQPAPPGGGVGGWPGGLEYGPQAGQPYGQQPDGLPGQPVPAAQLGQQPGQPAQPGWPGQPGQLGPAVPALPGGGPVGPGPQPMSAGAMGVPEIPDPVQPYLQQPAQRPGPEEEPGARPGAAGEKPAGWVPPYTALGFESPGGPGGPMAPGGPGSPGGPAGSGPGMPHPAFPDFGDPGYPGPGLPGPGQPGAGLPGPGLPGPDYPGHGLPEQDLPDDASPHHAPPYHGPPHGFPGQDLPEHGFEQPGLPGGDPAGYPPHGAPAPGGTEEPPFDPSATRFDPPAQGAAGPPAPARTRVFGADPEQGADAGPAVPGGSRPAGPGEGAGAGSEGPAGPAQPAGKRPPGTQIMSETMVAGFDFSAAPIPERPVGDIPPPPAERDRQVTELFGIAYVSGVRDGGEDVPDVEAFLADLRRSVLGAGGDATARDPHATTVDGAPTLGAPNVLLVGSPHTGQRRISRIIALTLADAGIGDGSIRITDAEELRGTATERVGELLASAGPVLLFERFDQAISGAIDPVALVAAVRSARSGRAASGTLIATCDPRAHRRLASDHPELLALFTVFRLPDLTDTENRLTLLHVLADERRVTVGDRALEVVREDLDRLRGPGDLVNARLVEAYLDQACQRHLGRAGGAGDRLVLIPEDFESVAESLEPALRPPGDVDGFLQRLDQLVGLDRVKRTFDDLLAEARPAVERARHGVTSDVPNRHLIFLGAPGVGKTTVAGLLGGAYAALGLLESGHLVACRPVHLAGRDALDTEQRVAAMIDQALGGVLLIQQAHRLDRTPAVVEELLRQMAERGERFMVICTGPSAEMENFLQASPGFRGEFGEIVQFGELSDRDLMLIFQRYAERDLYLLEEELRIELLARFGRMREAEGFAHARTVREIFEQTVARQASRLAGMNVDAATGARLTVGDLPESNLEQMLGHFHRDREG